jgi:hypothetical protein
MNKKLFNMDPIVMQLLNIIAAAAPVMELIEKAKANCPITNYIA